MSKHSLKDQEFRSLRLYLNMANHRDVFHHYSYTPLHHWDQGKHRMDRRPWFYMDLKSSDRIEQFHCPTNAFTWNSDFTSLTGEVRWAFAVVDSFVHSLTRRTVHTRIVETGSCSERVPRWTLRLRSTHIVFHISIRYNELGIDRRKHLHLCYYRCHHSDKDSMHSNHLSNGSSYTWKPLRNEWWKEILCSHFTSSVIVLPNVLGWGPQEQV